MKIAILGDVHGNLEALEAVLKEVDAWGAERILQVGDLVGYGPDPGAVIETLAKRGARVCLGNHDAAVAGLLQVEGFNAYAREAIQWTRKNLGPGHLDHLRQLPLVVEDGRLGVQLVHGSLHKPQGFDYVYSQVAAERSVDHQTQPLCFVGHTHIPCLFYQVREGASLDYEPEFEQGEPCFVSGLFRCLVNVGSVGQPRDQDSRAAWVRWDTDGGELRLERVWYDLGRTQEKILGAGLPRVLAERLSYGL